MAEKTSRVVAGYEFLSDEDAKQAQIELENINRLELKINYDNPKTVKMVYDKAMDARLFKTPVGYEFLRKLQLYLQDNPDIQEPVKDIQVINAINFRESTAKVKEKVRVANQKAKAPARERIPKNISIMANVVLIILVIVMFWISTTSSNPNILNYERAIQDKYSAWEQELSDRETVVRDKERELLIENDN